MYPSVHQKTLSISICRLSWSWSHEISFLIVVASAEDKKSLRCVISVRSRYEKQKGRKRVPWWRRVSTLEAVGFVRLTVTPRELIVESYRPDVLTCQLFSLCVFLCGSSVWSCLSKAFAKSVYTERPLGSCHNGRLVVKDRQAAGSKSVPPRPVVVGVALATPSHDFLQTLSKAFMAR